MNNNRMKKIISRISGFLFKRKFPTFIQTKLNWFFVTFLKIDLSEFNSVNSYKSLQEVFTRNLKKPREFSNDENTIISPVDSIITQYGTIVNGKSLQIKGVSYSVSEFLTQHTDSKKIKNGVFINFYLSPQDYHHFHSPVAINITKIIHVPGALFSVNPLILKKNKKVFVNNERVVLEGVLKNGGIFYIVFVGALDVGKIKILKEKRIQTNTYKKRKITVYKYTTPISFSKGEEIGYFELGSTVVMFFESNIIQLNDDLMNKKISFGDSIGKFSN